MALQNVLGLVCDPVANRVEVPCLGRNVMAASNALVCANMALAGYDPVVPLDEVLVEQRVAEALESCDHGYVLASTWIQCGPGGGIQGPFSKPGGRSNLGSEDDEQAAWNTNIDAIHPDAGILWWLEFVRDSISALDGLSDDDQGR